MLIVYDMFKAYTNVHMQRPHWNRYYLQLLLLFIIIVIIYNCGFIADLTRTARHKLVIPPPVGEAGDIAMASSVRTSVCV